MVCPVRDSAVQYGTSKSYMTYGTVQSMPMLDGARVLPDCQCSCSQRTQLWHEMTLDAFSAGTASSVA